MSRRSDRLFRLILLLDRRTPITAAALARALEVGTRTVYRDVADLMASGVPINGAPGKGYRLDASYRMPPLMFTADELEALSLGAEVVKGWAGADLARAADDALAKIRHALPKGVELSVDTHAVRAADAAAARAVAPLANQLRRAIKEHRCMALDYADAEGRASRRTVRPLALYYWGGRWTLAAWCELREDFRDFRLDRIASAAPIARSFTVEPGRGLADYRARIEALIRAAESGGEARPTV